MKYQTFTLNDRNEVEQFESLLSKYIEQRAQFPLHHISLVNAHDYLQQREDGGRVFSALLDVKINFILLYCDSYNVGATWNNNFSKRKLEGGSILDSPAKFFGKMDIHRYNSSFILRYRALWDKLMGLLILLFMPSEYDRFTSSKSKKRAFKKICRNIEGMPEKLIDGVEKIITDFDDNFRTPEAHGTGVLRKYSFNMESMDKNPQIELMGYWNIVNGFVSNIDSMFSEE